MRKTGKLTGIGLLLTGAFALMAMMPSLASVAATSMEQGRLLTVYDRGSQSSFITQATTIKAALQQASINLDPRDTVEPGLDEQLVASEYKVNIYRARPVIVVDGATRTKIMTPYQTPERIAQDAGTPLYTEDRTSLRRSSDLVGDGAGLQLTIERAVPLTLDLYGRKTDIRTQGKTVAELLKEKNITLGDQGRTSLALSAPVTAGMFLRVWREGKQPATSDQPIGFSTQIIYDADRPLGYRAVQTEGAPGVQTITYEVEIKDGQEVSRTEIARLVTQEPTTRIQVIGIQGLQNGLTKNKGALFSTDSAGVQHRETYYDLNMHVVMQACGQGGHYSVRFDGMKIDAEGYIIVAANYAKYPRCSVVQTSAGPARVYDTGGFVARYPDGFDLATDWSNPDGI